jgi:prophage regulatory protein
MTLLLRSVVMSPKKLISKKELKSIYGTPYSFAHIARLEVAGRFPRRIALGQCRVAWLRKKWRAGWTSVREVAWRTLPSEKGREAVGCTPAASFFASVAPS